MPGPFPSGGYGVSGSLIQDPEWGGFNFVPDQTSWAAEDPEEQAPEIERHTEVPAPEKPEEIVAPNAELEEATEFAHRIHEFSDWVTEDAESSKELHETLKEALPERHQPAAASQQPELHPANKYVGEARMPDDMGVEPTPVHMTMDVIAPMFAAAALALGAKAVSEFFGKGTDETAKEIAAEPPAEAETSTAPLSKAEPGAEAQPQPEQVVEAQQTAPAGLDVAPEPMPERSAELTAEEQLTSKAEAEPASDPEPLADSEPQAQQGSEVAAHRDTETETAAEASSPSMSPSFGPF